MARLHGKRWLASATDPSGTRLRPTFPTQSEAERWEEEARRAIAEGRPIPTPATGKADGRQGSRNLDTLGALFDHVKRTKWAGMRSASDAIRNGQHVVDYFGTKKAVAEITSAEIDLMMEDFAGRGMAAATVNRKVASLSKMLSVAQRVGVIKDLPQIDWNPEVQTKFRYLDDTEERVLTAFWVGQNNPAQADLCTLLLDTGARCFSEMIPVKWDHFTKDFASVTFWDTKTSKPRSVPVTKRCREVLRKRHQTGAGAAGPFYSAGRGLPAINKNTMRHQWDTMRAVTGLRDVTPHTLRHTCCTRLVLGGVDIKRVMTWMGHSAITTTMRYMQIRPSALEDVLHVLEREGV